MGDLVSSGLCVNQELTVSDWYVCNHTTSLNKIVYIFTAVIKNMQRPSKRVLHLFWTLALTECTVIVFP